MVTGYYPWFYRDDNILYQAVFSERGCCYGVRGRYGSLSKNDHVHKEGNQHARMAKPIPRTMVLAGGLCGAAYSFGILVAPETAVVSACPSATSTETASVVSMLVGR